MQVKKTVSFEGYEIIEREAKPTGNTCYLQVPKSWEGKKCAIALIEPLDEPRVKEKK